MKAPRALACTLFLTILLGLRPDPAFALIVNLVNGKEDRWSLHEARNLTYCIDAPTFGDHYREVVDAMEAATAAWEDAANVDFVHVPSWDNRCTRRTRAVMFNVRAAVGSCTHVRSFFPHMPRSRRQLVIDSAAFGDILPLTLAAVLREGIGHTLGFRHEHTRPKRTPLTASRTSTGSPLPNMIRRR